MTTQAKATRKFQYDRTIGRFSLSEIGFINPVALALGKNGEFYVVSRTNKIQGYGTRVTWCDIREEFHGEFGTMGTGDGEFTWPLAIAVNAEGWVFVSDEWLGRISIFTREGEFLGKWGAKGSGDGELNGPSGLVFDAEGNLLVADGGNHRVQKFTPEGKFLSKFGKLGAGDGELNYPWGITVDHQGNVYVADWRNDRIQKFDAGGQFLMKFGSSGTGEGQFNRPTGVAVDVDGDIYVTDWWNNRVQVFDAQGNFITLWTGDADLSKWAKLQLDPILDYVETRKTIPDLKEREGQFYEPVAVEVDEENRILVADCRRSRIQIYKKVS